MNRLLLTMFVMLTLAAVGFCAAVWQRHTIMLSVITTGKPSELIAAQDEGPTATWFDDYFIVVALDAQTFAIGEPRYDQQNFSYLIAGDERAVLFDAGPGHRDIRPVVESLTDLPITFVPSHFHYDHIGNKVTFPNVAVIDLPHIRDRAPDNLLTPTTEEHLGSVEGVEIPTLKIDRWLTPGSTLDLGGRQLTVLYTPGHTPDSVSLYDPAQQIIFTGDFIYPGPLYAFLPNSNMGDYLQGAETILANLPGTVRVLGAHRVSAPGVPELAMEDVADLQRKLKLIRSGDLAASGIFPRVYVINPRLQMLAEPGFLQSWDATYP